jgi:hypothetical protein
VPDLATVSLKAKHYKPGLLWSLVGKNPGTTTNLESASGDPETLQS